MNSNQTFQSHQNHQNNNNPINSNQSNHCFDMIITDGPQAVKKYFDKRYFYFLMELEPVGFGDSDNLYQICRKYVIDMEYLFILLDCLHVLGCVK